MDAGLLDVLHDGARPRCPSPSQSASTSSSTAPSRKRSTSTAPARLGRAATSSGVVADPHAPAAEDVGRPHEHRVADLLGGLDRHVGSSAMPQAGTAIPSAPQSSAKRSRSSARSTASIRRAEDADARLLERARQLERRLAAELDDDALRPLARADLQHLLDARAARSRAGRTCRSPSRPSPGCSSPSPSRSRGRGTSAPRGRSSSRTRFPGRSGSGPSRG